MLVVTNQAGVARGRLTMEKVEAALAELDRQLGEIITGWQVCPHDDAARCECRKPKGGMIADLTQIYGVDLNASTMVGDQEMIARQPWPPASAVLYLPKISLAGLEGSLPGQQLRRR